MRSAVETSRFVLDVVLFALLSGLVAAGRFAHSELPNFTPLTACSLFAGYWFAAQRNKLFSLPAVLVPACGLLISNLWLPSYANAWVMLAVFGCSMASAAFPGCCIKLFGKTPTYWGAALCCLAPSLQFFLITNGVVWLVQPSTYERSLAGVAACYMAGLPFYRNMVWGDVFYLAILAGVTGLARVMAARSAQVLAPATSRS